MISVVHALRWGMKYMFRQHFDQIIHKIPLGSILIMGVQHDARCTEGVIRYGSLRGCWNKVSHTKIVDMNFG